MVTQKKGQTVHADPWLVAFANIGFDDGKPRPAIVKLKHSRFLGLDARQKGYIFDPDREYEVIEDAGTDGGDLVKQTYRGVTKHWTRLKVRPDIMVPWLSQPEPPLTWGHVLGFTKEFPPRSIMHGGDCWPLWRMFQVEKGAEEMDVVVPLTPESSAALELWLDEADIEACVAPLNPQAKEAILHNLHTIRHAVRLFLESVYTLSAGRDASVTPGVVNSLHACISGTTDAIATVCLSAESPLGRAGTSGTHFDHIWADRNFQEAYETVVTRRAPIWMNVTSDLETRYVSDALPGIAWAECMNLFHDRAAWDLLRMCGWCGRFFMAAAAERGRPREFCSSSCKKRFHDYGPHDRRTARIKQ